MKTEAIVASAGLGKRLKGASLKRGRAYPRIRKPYLEISNKPILIHTLCQLSGCDSIDSIIVVVNSLDQEKCRRLIKSYSIKKVKAVVGGGRERSDSVYNGLNYLDKDTDIVLVHDGVRPFIDNGIIKRSIGMAEKFGACIVGVPVKGTVKKLKIQKSKFKIVDVTLDRSKLWEIQTPQVFRRGLILEAYRRFRHLRVTDDSMLIEKLGRKVMVIMGAYDNIKITTPEDLTIAEGILAKRA